MSKLPPCISRWRMPVMQCLLMIVADRRRLHWQCCCSYFAIVWWKLRGGSKAAKTRVAFCQSFKIAVQMGASTVACRGGRVFCTRAHGLAYESGRRQLPQRTSTTNKQRRRRPSGLCCVACRRRDYVVFLRHASVGTRHRKRCAGRIASSAGGASQGLGLQVVSSRVPITVTSTWLTPSFTPK